jgi:hypothetical protein
MKKRVLVIMAAFIAVLCCAGVSGVSFKPHADFGNDASRIIGVWKNVSSGSENSNQRKIKIITKGHFIWTHTLDNAIVLSLGGTCAFDGKTYTENIEYGVSSMKSYFGKKAVYEVVFKDKKMYIIGGIENESFDEV